MRFSDIADRIPGFRRRNRSPETFWKLAEPHIRLLYNVALTYTGNTYDAEDLVQESVYAGFRKFSRLRNDKKIKGWLLAIMRNRYLKGVGRAGQLSEYRDERPYGDELEALGAPDIERLYEQKETGRRIRDVLNMLPEKYRLPLILFYIEDLSYRDIAETLEIPVGTVMSRLSRGRVRLKAAWVRDVLLKSQPAAVVKFSKQMRGGGERR
jgi:RNA polymerase sigma-70 factor (ECF subfamily)